MKRKLSSEFFNFKVNILLTIMQIIKTQWNEITDFLNKECQGINFFVSKEGWGYILDNQANKHHISLSNTLQQVKELINKLK